MQHVVCTGPGEHRQYKYVFYMVFPTRGILDQKTVHVWGRGRSHMAQVATASNGAAIKKGRSNRHRCGKMIGEGLARRSSLASSRSPGLSWSLRVGWPAANECVGKEKTDERTAGWSACAAGCLGHGRENMSNSSDRTVPFKIKGEHSGINI
jgi:hypothetical protein